MHEHGPQGGDEVNIVRAGANYGWPIVTYGIGYDGSKIGEGATREGMESPRPLLGSLHRAFRHDLL
jgi:glucose/arabinose dehydrogenase